MTSNILPNQKRVIFAGIARNCEKFLPNVLKTINQLSMIFKESAYVFLENDSTDATKKILNDWGRSKKNFTFLNMDGLGQLPVRTLRLEYLRNACVQYIKNDSELNQYDYLIILDMDDVNSNGLDLRKINESISFLDQAKDRAAIFSNQNGPYYDMWALRHYQYCPNDLWEEVFEYAQNSKCSDQEAFDCVFKKRVFSIDCDDRYIEVDSAFGGLGIYKLSYVVSNPNPYLGSKVKIMADSSRLPMIFKFQTCEHVHFNRGIRSIGGRLFIKADLINGVEEDFEFNPSFYRAMIF